MIGAGLYEVEPGNKLWPYHTHHANEEWLLVVRGQPHSARRKASAGSRRVTSSAFRAARRGAHQVWNGTDSPIRVLMLSTRIAPDIVEYLDTGKVGARSVAGEPIMFGRPGPELEYWEGEE